MDLEKAYDAIDRHDMWQMVREYGVGKSVERSAKFYIDCSACIRVGNYAREWYPVNVGLREGCVMSPWLFHVYMDDVVRAGEC